MENRFLGGNFEAELNLESFLEQINIYITLFFQVFMSYFFYCKIYNEICRNTALWNKKGLNIPLKGRGGWGENKFCFMHARPQISGCQDHFAYNLFLAQYSYIQGMVYVKSMTHTELNYTGYKFINTNKVHISTYR
jgi:hypothetical protein